jgi:hypothetical protein
METLANQIRGQDPMTCRHSYFMKTSFIAGAFAQQTAHTA